MKKHNYFNTIVIFIWVAVLLGLNFGCVLPKYKTYVLEKNDIRFKLIELVNEHPRFSLEYPKSFGLLDWNKTPDFVYPSENYTEVVFRRRESGKLLSSELYILVFPNEPCTYYSPPFQNICYAIGGTYNDGRIIEDATIVDGVQAEVFKYTSQINNMTMYNKIAYFTYSSFNWAICLFSYEEFTEEMDSYFLHVLDTFKFIE
jgi:hypothetical protein